MDIKYLSLLLEIKRKISIGQLFKDGKILRKKRKRYFHILDHEQLDIIKNMSDFHQKGAI